MKKAKFLILASITSLCTMTGAILFASHELNNEMVLAAIPRPPEGPYTFEISNFKKYTYGETYFIYKTNLGNDITFKANYGGFSPLSDNYFTLLEGRDFYNDATRQGNRLVDAITDIIGIQILFNEGGSLELQASYCYVEISQLYYESYKFAGGAESIPISSGITYTFEKQNGHFPNRFELNAKADTTITNVNIAYRCGVTEE